VRKVLYMAALVASRYNPVIKAFYQRLLAQANRKGRPLPLRSQATHHPHAMVRTRQPFDIARHLLDFPRQLVRRFFFLVQAIDS